MDKQDIIAMAREAGAMFDHMTWFERDLAPVFERFATIVAAAEREACANVCEDLDLSQDSMWEVATLDCAAAIRARGESSDN